MKRLLVIQVFFVLLVPADFAAPSTQPVDYQWIADTARWAWEDTETTPLACETGGYDLKLERLAQDRYKIQITLSKNGEEAYSWTGHRFSVFGVVDNRLYYASFWPWSDGGSIVAVDLKTKRKIWESRLTAVPNNGHSAYENRILLDFHHAVLEIRGKETFGRYIEIKDFDTGETIGHRIFGSPDAVKSGQ